MKLTQSLSILISYTLIFMPLHAANLQTDGTTSTTLDTARNGVPVVNIANPNSTGLSHNKFREYNVAKEGLILNNSRDTTVNTQLGGHIFGNRNLSSNAKVILNEVTSTSRSQLNGYTEVAGKRADLVIANPNGLTINGAGFINTSNVTLTTGTPIINNGRIDSFNVLGGDISIDGTGLDTSTQDSTKIYTHYLKVNAAIHAKNLDIKLGRLDSSALGGMYANRISLVGTEQGLGVNLPPEVLASTGDITITNDGMISLQKVTAKQNININSDSSDINIDGALTSGTNTNLSAKNITNNALINSTNDLTITSDNLTNNRTLFSGNDMYLYTKDTLLNNENANILSVNNLNIAANSSNTKTALVKNYKANISTLNGDINIDADSLENITDEPIVTGYYNPTNQSITNGVNISKVTTTVNCGSWCKDVITIRVDSVVLDSESKGSTINSGRNININADSITNRYSLIAANKDIYLSSAVIDNQAIEIAEVTTTSTAKYRKDKYCKGKVSYPGGSYCYQYGYRSKYRGTSVNKQVKIIETIASTIQAGGAITGDVTNLNNANIKANVIPSSTTVDETADTITYTNPNDGTAIISVPKDNYGIFIQTTNPNSSYLIETNPEFALYENFISSDYMMSHIDYDAEATTKRLGDAFYENTLIRDSIFTQTGRRFLSSDIKDDNDQFKYLMDNAIEASQDLELSPGISLNKEQINALTKDIVWMEEQIVQGERVLVPVVYIADVNKFKLEGAKIIAGDSINLKVANLTNAGTMQAGNNLNIEATDSITNYGGSINADEGIKLLATSNITNTSGTIKANNIEITSTDGSVINERYTKSVSYGKNGTKDNKVLIGDSSNIQASNTLNINAAKDITVEGSKLQANELNINATNVNITTTVDKKDFFGGDSDNYIKEQSTTHLASNLNAQNININSRKTATIKGSNLNATDSLNVKAKKIDVLAVNNTTYNESKTSEEGFLSSSQTTTKQATSRNQASNLSGANVELTTTEEDIDVIGSDLNAKKLLALNSAKNVNINAGYNIDHQESKTIKTSMFSGGDLYSSSMDNIGSYDKTNVSSNLNANNININSKNTNITGSNLNADANIDINADNINIQTAKDEHKTWEQHEEISLSFSQAAEGVAKLGVEMATLSLADTGSNDVISTKATYSDTKEQTTSIINQASNINAGENLSLSANNGNIDVIGSNLVADGSTTLNATNNINILAAHDTNSHSYEETSGYVEMKITTDEGIETDIDLTLRDEAEDASNAKASTISSGKDLTLISNNDTTIIGSNTQAQGTTSMQTDGELKIAAAKNKSSSSIDNLNIHIHAGGIPDVELGDGQLEVELGRATVDKIKKTTTNTTASKSNISSDENIELTSKKSILVEGSDLNAKEEVTLIADEDVTIKETKETSKLKSDELHGVAIAKFVVANEYAKIAYAVLGVKEAKEGVEKSKDNYDDYKKELSSQKAKLSKLQQDYKNGVGFIELVDVEEFTELVDDLREDGKYYKANIALAVTTLATKTTALAAQIAKAATAASGSFGTGFSAGIELDIDAIEKQLEEYSTASVASNIKANIINIQANNKATIQGSTLQAKENIDITATNTDILASKDNYDQKEDTQHQNVNISISTAGFSMSASADSTESNTNATTNANSTLLANNISINTDETTNIKGANVNAQETLTLNTKNLNAESVQDRSKTRSHSIGMSAGFGASGLSSLGANSSNANSKSKQTIQTDLTASEVSINVEEHTKLKGATIASIDEEGKDNNNLNFKTNTLTASSLNNTHNSKSTSIGIQAGVTSSQSKDINKGIKDGTTEIDGASTIALDYTNDRTNSKTKTLATLGNGNIQIANEEQSDTKMLNTDIANNTVDIYNISSHKGLQGELDTRLLTEDGRNQIADDMKKSKVGFYDVAKDIITSDSLTIVDSFTHQGNKVDMYEGVQTAIRNDKDLQDKLASPNLTTDEKNTLLRDIASSVAQELDIKLADVSTISTDKQTQDAKEIQGGYHAPSGDIAINDKNINNTGEAINTLGHELAHSLDTQRGETRDGTTTDGESYSDEYASIMGDSLQDYAEFGMWNYTDNSLASTNTHNRLTPSTSVFSPNYNQATQNFENRVDGGEIEYRQLAQQEVALNYTQDAESIKRALADTHSNLSKQDIDNIFESTQKGMVNKFDNYMMNLQLNTTYKDRKEDIRFVSQEAQIYFSEAAKDKVYTDRNTLTNRPMMDTNNYNDSTYNPASNQKIVGDTVTSVGLTAAGLVPNPIIAIPAWTADTIRNASNNDDWSDGVGTIQNVIAPAGLGQPFVDPIFKEAPYIGASVSLFNTLENVDNYSKKIDSLEEQRDSINNGNLKK